MEPRTPRSAAVLLLIYPRHGQPHVVFTVRTQLVATHRGHVSLPGGSWEPSDPTLEFTARREAQEELGIPGDQVRILGVLGEVATLGGSFRITPYVGLLETEPEFRAQPDEVAMVLEAPLDLLRDPRITGEDEHDARGTRRRVRYYQLGEHRIFGPTGLAVQQFLATDLPETAVRIIRQTYGRSALAEPTARAGGSATG